MRRRAPATRATCSPAPTSAPSTRPARRSRETLRGRSRSTSARARGTPRSRARTPPTCSATVVRGRPRSRCWRRGCAMQEPGTCFQLGRLLRSDDAGAPDPERAYALIRDACRARLLAACVEQAEQLRDGEGIARDPAAAYALLNATCERNSVLACAAEGAMALDPHGPAYDRERGARLMPARAPPTTPRRAGPSRSCSVTGPQRRTPRRTPPSTRSVRARWASPPLARKLRRIDGLRQVARGGVTSDDTHRGFDERAFDCRGLARRVLHLGRARITLVAACGDSGAGAAGSEADVVDEAPPRRVLPDGVSSTEPDTSPSTPDVAADGVRAGCRHPRCVRA